MNAKEFIDELEQREILPERLIAKLRKKVADSSESMPASSLARFLVQKKHLPGYLAQEILNEPFDLITDVDSTDDEGGPASSIETVVLTPVEDFEQRSALKQGTTDSADMDDPLVADLTLRDSPSSVIRKKPKKTDGKVREKTRERERRRKERSRKKPKRKNEWDSPLFLFGGGGLILLVLVGITVWYLIFRDTGDDQLRMAQTAKNQGSYSQAISQYEKFLADFPSHPDQSIARVELGMVRLRRATEGRSDFRVALKVADDEINAIQNEEKFEDSHDELATLLPQIASGLANNAEQETDPVVAGELVALATHALELCANPKYVPRNLRDDAELLVVRGALERVEQRRQSYTDLQAAVAAMEQAIQAGDTRGAYEAHRAHVKAHPEQSGDAQLMEMVAKTSAAEKDGISFIRAEQAAETSARPSAVLASLALAEYRGGAASAATGVVGVVVDGALYGIDLKTGHLLWRRFVGFDAMPFVQTTADGLLVRDAKSHDLLMIEPSSGDLRWRQPLEFAFAQPLVLGPMAYVASQSGKLFVIELKSGAIAGHLQFAQPLPVTPAVDRSGQRLYIVGEHSSVYSVSRGDLTCQGVYYLGHTVGSVSVPPACVLNKVALFENLGVESSQLHILAIDESGALAESVHDQRLDGLVTTPALVAGRRLAVLTDRGAIDVFDIGSQSGPGAVTSVATRAPSSSGNVTSHALLTDRNIWVADQQLTKYAIQPTDNRLPVRDIADDYRGAAFDHPLQEFENVLVHVRRPTDRAGAAVGAMDMNSGKTFWEIDLAVPPASAPVVSAADQSITIANRSGSLFSLDRQAIRRRVLDGAVETLGRPRVAPNLSHGISLGNGLLVYSDPAGKSPWLLLHQGGSDGSSSRWLELPSPLNAPPVPVEGKAIVPTAIGQVMLVDPTQTEPLASVFQPRLQPRQTIPWLPPGSSPSHPGKCVLADGNETIYLLQASEGGNALTAETEKQIGGLLLETRLSLQSEFATAATRDKRLAVFSIPELEVAREVSLPGRVVWGPHPVGEQVLLALDNNQLASVSPASGQIDWQASLTNNANSGLELAGEPLLAGQEAVLAMRNGTIRFVSLASGETTGELDLEQPLASGVVALQGRLLVAAHDGTLLVFEKP